jgi:hypothetical protein
MSRGGFSKGPGSLAPGFGANDKCIGPELGFGAKALAKVPTFNINKCSWGGTSLYKDWRPPSAGGTTGPLYIQFLASVKEAF